MELQRIPLLTLLTCLLVSTIGCRSGNAPVYSTTEPAVNASDVHPIQYPDIEDAASLGNSHEYLARPRTRLSDIPDELQEISLDQAIGMALQDTQILRTLGASVVQNPQAAASSFDPAIQSTDPNFGMEAALSEFDANLSSSVLYQNNDDIFNNPSTTAGAFEVQQKLTTMNFGLNKVAATGTQFRIGSNIRHDSTTNPSVLFPHSWTTDWEATVRHPLLQGGGIGFNRIAGPTSRPGFQGSAGFLVSRTNHDISIAQLERGVREMVLEVINSYWQLSLAYKNLESIKKARDGALETWNIAKARFDNNLAGGEADREAQAREQYYLFESQLQEALNGAQTNGSPGVLQAEANLRRLLNLPQSDAGLLYPVDTPVDVESVHNWNDLVEMALGARTELREQLWRIKQNEMIAQAAHNFTMPRLDAIATYRNNGFGDDLIGGTGRFGGAVDVASSGDYDEWEFGFALDMPIGFRRAHAGVRNAYLELTRERAVLKEMQKQILHDLGSALRQVDQSYATIELSRLRRDAASDTVRARQAAYEADAVGFDELLNAQQRLLDAELNYQQAMADYELSRETLHSESGRLLQEHQIHLGEAECLSFDATATYRASAVERASQDYRFLQFGSVTQ